MRTPWDNWRAQGIARKAHVGQLAGEGVGNPRGTTGGRGGLLGNRRGTTGGQCWEDHAKSR